MVVSHKKERMLAMRRAATGLLLTAALFGSATLVPASAGTPHPTDHQAAYYLIHHLTSWSGVDLHTARSKSAFCVKAAPQNDGDQKGPPSRSFACVLNATAESKKTYVFGLYLVARTRSRWRVTALR